MKDITFWNTCVSGNIREAVARFIDNSPILSNLEGAKYYELEDSIVAFIEENKEMIFREVDKEYQRDDVVTLLKRKYGEERIEEIMEYIPMRTTDAIIDGWKECPSDRFNDAYWESLEEYINEVEFLRGLDELPDTSFRTYKAYLKWWEETDEDFDSQLPLPPNDFFDCECNDIDFIEFCEELGRRGI